MTAIVIEDNDYATLWYYPDKKIIHHKFKKFIHGKVFHDFLLIGTTLMRENGATKWLSDDRLNPVLRQDDMTWGDTNWFPQTVDAGWKYWAVVQPKSMIASLNMQKLVSEYEKAGLTAQFFMTPEEALAWLENLP
ncbi:MAG: hypothetical protein JEZ00_09970 [Anaerolineaceae bacterium]|nr:hypothetical protein [Anaerolineaceae bacterium]